MSVIITIAIAIVSVVAGILGIKGYEWMKRKDAFKTVLNIGKSHENDKDRSSLIDKARKQIEENKKVQKDARKKIKDHNNN